MRFRSLRAMPCLLAVPAVAQAPLTFQVIQSKARPAPEQWQAEALLAAHRLQSQEGQAFLREGPTLALLAGPRRTPGSSTGTDKSFEVDLPLFLSPGRRSALQSGLGKAHPLIVEAARREGLFRLKRAYLDAWMASRIVLLREADLGTVDRWLEAARLRVEAGADPAFQVSLVEGELLKAHQELDEAKAQESHSWSALAALADLPAAPVPLADPGPVPLHATVELERRSQEGPIRKALLAQADLETQSLRLKEALALSRWSVRGNFAQEGDDKVTRLGVAMRVPRPGESASIRRNTEAQVQAIQGEARLALADLDARTAGAIQRVKRSFPTPVIPDFAGALEAIGLRLREGRERPSEALPIRRQLLESQMASLRHIHSQHLLAAELQTLLSEVNP